MVLVDYNAYGFNGILLSYESRLSSDFAFCDAGIITIQGQMNDVLRESKCMRNEVVI